jgi:hypothetical protein
MTVGVLILWALGLAIAHFITSFFVSFAAGIGGNTPMGTVFTLISKILTFPLWLSKDNNSDEPQTLLMWWPWATLSLVWGTALAFVIRHFTTK